MAELFDPRYQAVDANGLPLAGASLAFYIAGTTTQITVYQNQAGTTPHTNPVIADANGNFPAIYIGISTRFKIILKDSNGVTVQTVDDILPGGSVADGVIIRDTLSEPLRGVVLYSPLELNAAGNESSNDTSAVAATVDVADYGGEVYLPQDKSFLVTSFANLKGVLFRGPGRIVTAVTGGFRQRNRYSDAPGKLHFGHAWVNRVYQFFNLGQGSGLGSFYIRIFGDSTATDSYGDYGPSAVVRRVLARRGIFNYILENYAVGGTRWDQLNTSDLSGVSLAIISYGVNDPANGASLDARLAALYTNMDTKLAAARAIGNAGTLAIILKMPNSTSDSPNNRDEVWYEKIRGIYVYMAQKYQCALFDTYGQFPDSRDGAAGTFMDNPYGDGRAIHPASGMNNWVWGKLVDEFFGDGALSMYGTNLFTNEGAQTSALTAATAPSAFRLGISVSRATTGNGWPIDGFVFTTKNVDSGVKQELWNYSNGPTRVAKRTAHIALDTWNEWNGLTQAYTPTVASSSGTITTASATGVYTIVDGVVHFEATVTITTNGTGAGSVVISLPKANGGTCRGILIGKLGTGTGNALSGTISTGSSSVGIVTYANAYPGVDGAVLHVSGSYLL